MKKWYINVEYVLVFIVILGLVFRLIHTGPSDLFIMVGLLTLAVWYMFFGLTATNGIPFNLSPFLKDTPFTLLEAFVLKAIGLAIAASLIGLLFQILKWEGGYFMLMVGGISSVVGLILSYFILRLNRAIIYNFIFFRQLPITFMTLVMFYLGDSLSAF